jgi:hypothetical protein
LPSSLAIDFTVVQDFEREIRSIVKETIGKRKDNP